MSAQPTTQPTAQPTAEQVAGRALQDKAVKMKVRAFDYCISCAYMTLEELRHAGYNSAPEAILATLYNADRQIETDLRAHEHKYPAL